MIGGFRTGWRRATWPGRAIAIAAVGALAGCAPHATTSHARAAEVVDTDEPDGAASRVAWNELSASGAPTVDASGHAADVYVVTGASALRLVAPKGARKIAWGERFDGPTVTEAWHVADVAAGHADVRVDPTATRLLVPRGAAARVLLGEPHDPATDGSISRNGRSAGPKGLLGAPLPPIAPVDRLDAAGFRAASTQRSGRGRAGQGSRRRRDADRDDGAPRLPSPSAPCASCAR